MASPEQETDGVPSGPPPEPFNERLARRAAARQLRPIVPLGRRFAPTTIVAAAWTKLALEVARRSLRRHGIDGIRTLSPPPLPLSATRGVEAALGRTPNSCLERAVVLQRWWLAHDIEREIVIGVDREGGEVLAHAWLDYEDGSGRAGPYAELTRVPPRR